jgi:2-polyprenyl-6-methoxyphenol hydroxylase-like FAD-dependent oxidoreductase
MEHIPVLISGAGPVGLSLALGLARCGVRPLVVERKAELDPHSRALVVLPRTLEILRSWGVFDAFVADGFYRTSISIHTPGQGEPVATIDLSPLKEITAAAGVLALPQDRTEALLLRCLQEEGLAEVRFGHQLTGFRQDERGVRAQVTGPDGGAYELECDYLAGCDGAHSTVRDRLGWELEGKTYPTRIALVDVRLTDDRDGLPWPRISPQPKGVLAGIRYRAEFWRIIATMDPGDDEPALPQEAIAEMVERLFGAGPFETVWSSVFRIHCRTSPHFYSGRVVLAGDAAHINSPAGAQGMNAGMQDAHNLAWKLARLLRGGTPSLLASYEQERRAAVMNYVDRITDLLTRSVFQTHPLVRNALLGAARAVLSLPTFDEKFAVQMGMLDTRYPESALFSGDGPWIGRRAPDGELLGPGAASTRLLDLAGPQAALLLFDDGRLPAWSTELLQPLLGHVPDLRIVRIAREGAAPADGFSDRTGRLWGAWQATGDTAALLRPDGYVGWTARRPTDAGLRSGVERALGVPDSG